VIALDTNVLVRYLVEDDPDQARRAAALIEENLQQKDTQAFVTLVTLCELVWVLRTAYSRPKGQIVAVLKGLLRAVQVEIERVDIAHRAVAAFEAGKGDFADYVIRECGAAAGCESVATFDKALLHEPGFVAL
jgi:predicted nucleic-acid-binding protein